MIRTTLFIALAIAILLLCGSPSHIDAQGDTPIVVGDSSSLMIRPLGLDAGSNWNLGGTEIKHANPNGILRRLIVSDGGTNQCNQTCGIDTTKPWYVTVTYSSGTLTISSLPSTNQGIHLTQQGLAPFDQWTTDGTADDRVFHTGDGQHILGISVNGGIANLCSGAGACQIIASYR